MFWQRAVQRSKVGTNHDYYVLLDTHVLAEASQLVLKIYSWILNCEPRWTESKKITKIKAFATDGPKSSRYEDTWTDLKTNSVGLWLAAVWQRDNGELAASQSWVSAAVLSCPDTMREEKFHLSCRETSRNICLQVLPSYLLAGQGMVSAGMLLDRVQVSRFRSFLCESRTLDPTRSTEIIRLTCAWPPEVLVS